MVRFFGVDVSGAAASCAVVVGECRGGAEAAKAVAKMEFSEGACVGGEVKVEGGD